MLQSNCWRGQKSGHHVNFRGLAEQARQERQALLGHYLRLVRSRSVAVHGNQAVRASRTARASQAAPGSLAAPELQIWVPAHHHC